MGSQCAELLAVACEAFMSDFSRVQALLQRVEEMARLIAELCDLRIRVQQAEARALARRQR